MAVALRVINSSNEHIFVQKTAVPFPITKNTYKLQNDHKYFEHTHKYNPRYFVFHFGLDGCKSWMYTESQSVVYYSDVDKVEYEAALMTEK